MLAARVHVPSLGGWLPAPLAARLAAAWSPPRMDPDEVHRDRAGREYVPVGTAPGAAREGVISTQRIQARNRGEPRFFVPRDARVPARGTPHVSRAHASGRPVPWCRRSLRAAIYVCADGHTHWRYVPCAQRDCWTCRRILARRRGRAIYERFGRAGMGYAVLTLPRWLRDRIGIDAARELRRHADLAVRDWLRAEYGVEAGTVASLHPAGDEVPAEWRPHVHIGWPLVGLRGGQVAQLPGYHPAHMVDRLRARWAAVIDACALAVWRQRRRDGVAPDELPPERTPPESTVVHLRYARADDPIRVYHHARYDHRPWPAWYAGSLPEDLATYRVAGLAAPGCRAPGIDAWRDAVRGDWSRVAAAVEDAELAGDAQDGPDAWAPVDADDDQAEVRAGRRCPCGAALELAGVALARDTRGLPLDLRGVHLTDDEIDGEAAALARHRRGRAHGLDPPPSAHPDREP